MKDIIEEQIKIINVFDGEYAFLSNFYNSPIEYEGIRYPTVEHAFQAAKTLCSFQREDIAKASTPGIAKRMGRKIILRPDWEKVKDFIMETCLRLKFENSQLKEKLLATENAILIEGNFWHDNYWGICACDKCEGIHAKNMLGNLLVKIREELKNESNK